MSTDRFVVVAETGLSRNDYGATIRTSPAVGLADAQGLLEQVAAGRDIGFGPLPADATVLEVEPGRQLLVLSEPRLRPATQSRYTVARVLWGPPVQ